MTVGTPGKLIASSFGLAGFAVAIVAGLAAGNPGDRVLTVALTSMFVCYLIGLCAGHIGERIVEEYMTRYRESHPLEAPGGESSPNPGAQTGTS